MSLSRLKDSSKNIIIAVIIFFSSFALVGCRYAGSSNFSPSKKAERAADILAHLELASEYFVEGMNALRSGDSADALKCFETAFMLDTGSRFLYDRVIEISMLSDNPGSAVRAIMRGREYSKISDDELRKLFAIFSRYRYFNDAFEAISAVKEKTKRDTILLAGICEQTEKYLFAAQLFKTQFPDTSFELQFKVADLHRRAGLFATAESLFMIVAKKQPDNISVKRGLLFSYIGQNETKSARKILDEILSVDSLNYEMWYLLGTFCEQAYDFTKAVESYKKSIKINPDFVDANWSLMVLCTKTGDFETAKILAKKLSEKYPQKIEYWAVLGTIYNAKSSYDSALVALNKVLEFGIRTPTVLFELGMASERTGKFEDAENYFKETLEIDPKYAIAANYLGYMWAEKGINLNEAEKLLLSALQEEPDNGAYLDSYGWILFQQKRYKEAEKPLLRSLELITDDYVVYYHLGELYLKLGDKKNALNYFIKANNFKNNSDFEAIEKKNQRPFKMTFQLSR